MTSALSVALGPVTTGRAPLFAISVLVLLVLRLALLLLLWVIGGEPLQPDSPLYLRLATGLVEHGWFSSSLESYQPEVFRTPGYPAFLGLFKGLGLDATFYPLLAQEFLYLGTVAVFFFGTRALLDLSVARALAIFLLIEPGSIAYPKLILSDTLNLALSVPAILALGWHLKTGRWSWLFASGVLLGAAAWVRPAAFLLPIVFAPVFLVTAHFRRVGFLQAGLLALVTILILSPWLVRNQMLFGTPYLSGQASNMLANYHLPYLWEVTRGLSFQEGQREAVALAEQLVSRAETQQGEPLNKVERLNLQQQAALEELLQHPVIYAQRWLIGMLKTLLGPGLLDTYAAYGHESARIRFSMIAETSLIRKTQIFLAAQDWLVLTEVTLRGCLLILALVGAVSMLREGSPFLWIIILFSAYTIAAPGPMGLTRLRFAAEGFLFIQAWLGLRYGLLWIGAFNFGLYRSPTRPV